jgi:HPr kinase/phosphorylase
VLVRDLHSEQSLGLELVAGQTGLDKAILVPRVRRLEVSAGTLVRQGQSDPLEAGSLVLLDARQLAKLAKLSTPRRKRFWETLAEAAVAGIVLPDSAAAPGELLSMAGRHGIAVLATSLKRPSVELGRALKRNIARRQVVHGVLMDVHGLGTLILGESGIGKSESAIELIERGHRLVADDVVEIQSSSGALVGRSPDVIRYYMEVRGLGVINIKDLFGAGAIKTSMPVQLVIQLERWEAASPVERLGLDEEVYSVLGVDLPLVRMPVGPGRNLAMLIEVAARNQLMNAGGRNAARILAHRVSRAARRRATGGDASGKDRRR